MRYDNQFDTSDLPAAIARAIASAQKGQRVELMFDGGSAADAEEARRLLQKYPAELVRRVSVICPRQTA